MRFFQIRTPAKIAFLAPLLSLALTLPTHARSMEETVTPKTLDQNVFAFAVSTSATKDGVLFRVTITAKKGEMPSNLGCGFVTYEQKEDGAVSEGPRTDIPYTIKKGAGIWTVEFVLSGAQLKDTSIRLVFSQTWEEAANMYEIDPHDFLKQ